MALPPPVPGCRWEMAPGGGRVTERSEGKGAEGDLDRGAAGATMKDIRGTP